MKFIEGAFLPKPAISSIIEFDHGPFQNISRNGGTVFLFRSTDSAEQRFADSLRHGLLSSDQGAAPIEVFSKLPSELRILEYEMVFNHIMLNLMQKCGEACDQVNFNEGSNYGEVI